ncbi:hypothetical protein [Borrelia anserina]|uniref:hypothetical protein n=1 Tax=Borrelia anserina TaxID=143 RepID=UPI000A45DA7F|nr:hypothetical protein [Borrelia anserina]
MKGFLGIRLSNNEYFSILSLDDTAVKRVVLGRLKDETNVKLDFYISEYEDFSNSVFIGSFFLNDLRKENSNINIYFKIESMILYVYGECDEIASKSKFDLSSISLDVNSGNIGDSFENAKSNDLPVNFSSVDRDRENEFVKELDNVVVQEQDDSLGDNIDNLLDSQDLFEDEKLSSNIENLDLLSDSLSTDNDTLASESLNSDSNLGLELEFKRDKSKDGIGHVLSDEEDIVSQDTLDFNNLPVDINDTNVVTDDSDSNVLKLVEDSNTNFSSVNVHALQDSYSDDWSVDDIITDINKDLGGNGVDDVTLDFSKEGFVTDIKENQLDLDPEEGFIETSMLYLSLISFFLLIFFSLFLIFSKLLNPKNFVVSYYSFCREAKITKYEKSNHA